MKNMPLCNCTMIELLKKKVITQNEYKGPYQIPHVAASASLIRNKTNSLSPFVPKIQHHE